MGRILKDTDGEYHVGNKSFKLLMGSRQQVGHETAYKTSGGLTKADLIQTKDGRWKSLSKHKSAKKDNRLVKAGYCTQKGKFGYVKCDSDTRMADTRSSSCKYKRGSVKTNRRPSGLCNKKPCKSGLQPPCRSKSGDSGDSDMRMESTRKNSRSCKYKKGTVKTRRRPSGLCNKRPCKSGLQPPCKTVS
jgi:hypothetical protein